MKKQLRLALFVLVGWVQIVKAEPASLERARGTGEAPMLEAVDTPTPDILDPMTYSVNFRFYNEGGITSRLVIGPLRRVNLGLSFDTQHIVGSGDPQMIRPSVYFKLKVFDGSDILPALALGYDNQGQLYDKGTRQFFNREKGLYFVFGHEIFIPNLEIHAGANVYDFDNAKKSVGGFVGSTFKVTPSFALLAEYDNIHDGPENRVNFGGRYYVAPYFYVDIAARNVGRGTNRGAERIVRLNYCGNFPTF